MTEIFGRFDFDVIARWIREGERVLDLGCGDGSLLKFLQAEKGIRGYGVENDPGNVLADAYDTASGALDRARERVSDVRVGDAIDTVSGAVDELSPLIAAAASGDPQALIAAADPLARLAGAASSCAGRAL